MPIDYKGIKLEPVKNVANAMDLYIYSFIGEDFWEEGFNENTLRDALDEHGAVNTINVHINSQGGSVFSGIAIYNVLRNHPATINVKVEGYAASIASVIMLAGDTREAMQGTSVMIHDPSTFAAGTSSDLRKTADVLDGIKDQIISIYVDRTNLSAEDAAQMMTDETWMNADKALEFGFATAATDQQAEPENMSGLDVSMYRRAPSNHQVGKTMPREVVNQTDSSGASNNADQGAAQTNQPAQAVAEQPTPQAAAPTGEVIGLQERNDQIRMMMQISPDMASVLTDCLADTSMSLKAVRNKVMQAKEDAADNQPVARHHSTAHGEVQILADERDKYINGAQQWIFSRYAVNDKDGKRIVCARDNTFRGMSVSDLARYSLNKAGVRTDGLTKSEIANLVFSNRHSTSDFSVLLENTLHKVMLNAYAQQRVTWPMFCRIGSANDYRDQPRYKMGYGSDLAEVLENGELKHGTIGDAEKEVLRVTRKGLILSFTHELFVDDDMGVFINAAQLLGTSSARAPEVAFYDLLNMNSGLGPTMADGQTMFHADHSNIAAAGALSAANIDATDKLLGQQRDPNDKDYIDLQAHLMLVHRGNKNAALRINRDANDPDINNKTRTNAVQGLVEEVVWTPRLTEQNSYYLFADPAVHPAFEMAFLDGQQEPTVEQQDNFNTDGKDYKIQMKFGVAALDHRPVVRNAGA